MPASMCGSGILHFGPVSCLRIWSQCNKCRHYYKHDPIYATLIIIFMLLASEFLVAINTACATILSVGTMGMCIESVTDSYKKKLVYQDHEMAA